MSSKWELIMGWIAAIFGLVLLFSFPKEIFTLAFWVAIIWGVIYFYNQQSDLDKERQRNSVKILIKYDESVCPNKKLPIIVTFKNQSRKTINKITWNFAAYNAGYSDNVMAYGVYGSKYNAPYSSDKILAPFENFVLCYPVLTLRTGNMPETVNWKAINKSVDFK